MDTSGEVEMARNLGIPFLSMFTRGNASYGLLTPASWAALYVRRYMHQYGATNADFAPTSVVDRKHASNNPAAWFHERPITIDDH